MISLVKYEAAKHAIAAAKAVDEVKQIHDVSAAMQAYARQAKDRQLEVDASEIRIRAERRLGEMIRAQKDGPGLADGGDAMRARYSIGTEVETRPTLAAVGIDKKLSSRSQAIASIPEDAFEETLAEHREEQQAVTAKTMEKLARKGKEVAWNYDPVRGSSAMDFARLATRQLERIPKKDPRQNEAYDYVQQWMDERREK